MQFRCSEKKKRFKSSRNNVHSRGRARCCLSIDFILLFISTPDIDNDSEYSCHPSREENGVKSEKIVSNLKIVNNTRNEINITDKIFILPRFCDNYFFYHQVSEHHALCTERNFFPFPFPCSPLLSPSLSRSLLREKIL